MDLAVEAVIELCVDVLDSLGMLPDGHQWLWAHLSQRKVMLCSTISTQN